MAFLAVLGLRVVHICILSRCLYVDLVNSLVAFFFIFRSVIVFCFMLSADLDTGPVRFWGFFNDS